MRRRRPPARYPRRTVISSRIETLVLGVARPCHRIRLCAARFTPRWSPIPKAPGGVTTPPRTGTYLQPDFRRLSCVRRGFRPSSRPCYLKPCHRWNPRHSSSSMPPFRSPPGASALQCPQHSRSAQTRSKDHNPTLLRPSLKKSDLLPGILGGRIEGRATNTTEVSRTTMRSATARTMSVARLFEAVPRRAQARCHIHVKVLVSTGSFDVSETPPAYPDCRSFPLRRGGVDRG